MDAHEMEQFLEQLTEQERHRMFTILRRLHLRDRLRVILKSADAEQNTEQNTEQDTEIAPIK